MQLAARALVEAHEIAGLSDVFVAKRQNFDVTFAGQLSPAEVLDVVFHSFPLEEHGWVRAKTAINRISGCRFRVART